MPRGCSICARDDRHDLDRRLAAGAPVKTLAAERGVSPDALRRHQRAHLPVRLVQQEVLREARDTLDVGRLLAAANGATVEVLAQARQTNRPDLVLRAVDRLLACLLLQVRITEAADAAELQERLVALEEKLAGAGVGPGITRRLGGAGWPRTGP